MAKRYGIAVIAQQLQQNGTSLTRFEAAALSPRPGSIVCETSVDDPRLSPWFHGHIRKEPQQLAVKRQQRALQLLGEQHEFSVVAGAAGGMGQLESFRTRDGHGLRQKTLLRITEVEQGPIQIKQTCPQISQMNVAKLADP